MPGSRLVSALAAGMWPLALIAGAAWWRWHGSPPPMLANMGLPFVVCGVAAVLAWSFHSGRVFLAAIVVGLATAVLMGGVERAHEHRMWVCLSWMVPLNLVGLALLPERPVPSAATLWRLAGLLLQILVIAWLTPPSESRILAALTAHPFGTWSVAWPQGAAAIGLLGLFLLGVRVGQRNRPFDVSLLGVMVGIAMALQVTDPLSRAVLLTTTAGILVLGVLQMSHGMAYRDELTGLPGRRALEDELSALRGRFTIAMVDVDHFKKFNDRHGHDVGDQCLRLVASRLRDVQDGGRSFRYGGEEFTVLFPGRSAEDCRDSLETLRRSIEKNRFVLRSPDRPTRKPEVKPSGRSPERAVTVTVSIGFAEPGKPAERPTDVIKSADKALYRAKKQGRNQVSS